MKKLWLLPILAAFAAGLCGLWPMEGTEVAELLPARVLLLERTDGTIFASCGAASGIGATLERALSDMEESAAGELFLDTAEHVILHTSAYDLLAQAAQNEKLRPAAKVYLAEGELPDADEAADFLRTHYGSVTLGGVRAALLGAEENRPPHLVNREGRLHLVEE